MSSKDNPLAPSSTPISSSSPAQIVPVDLATNKPLTPSVAQIRFAQIFLFYYGNDSINQ